jgi:hypothetical protein
MEEVKYEKTSSKKKKAIGIIIIGILLLSIGGVLTFSGQNQLGSNKQLSDKNSTTNEDNKDNEDDKSLPILMQANIYYTGEFWEYKTKIKTITFETKIDIPSDAVKSWDVSEYKNGLVMAYIKTNESDTDYYDLYIQGKEKIYANPISSFLFADFSFVDNINNMSVLDTSKVITMDNMFLKTGYSSAVFTLDLGENFDTSNVVSMFYMFAYTGYSSPVFTLNLGDKWDTSNVYNVTDMFASTGASSLIFTLDCRNWKIDQVTNYEGFNKGSESKVTPPTWKN